MSRQTRKRQHAVRFRMIDSQGKKKNSCCIKMSPFVLPWMVAIATEHCFLGISVFLFAPRSQNLLFVAVLNSILTRNEMMLSAYLLYCFQFFFCLSRFIHRRHLIMTCIDHNKAELCCCGRPERRSYQKQEIIMSSCQQRIRIYVLLIIL